MRRRAMAKDVANLTEISMEILNEGLNIPIKEDIEAREGSFKNMEI